MDSLDMFASRPMPTAARPLLGLTILVVEDSRFTCEALRLLCLKSGARIRRADCLRSARRHLQTYRPAVAIVDMGLPDGTGADLIRELCQTTPAIPAVLGMSGNPELEQEARDAGAPGFLEKPLHSLAAFQEAVLRHLPADFTPPSPRQINDEEIVPDELALRDDLSHAADLMTEDAAPETLTYLGQFLTGVARSADDSTLYDAAQTLTNSDIGAAQMAQMSRVAALVQNRLEKTAQF